jgi:hypothetical protein
MPARPPGHGSAASSPNEATSDSSSHVCTIDTAGELAPSSGAGPRALAAAPADTSADLDVLADLVDAGDLAGELRRRRRTVPCATRGCAPRRSAPIAITSRARRGAAAGRRRSQRRRWSRTRGSPSGWKSQRHQLAGDGVGRLSTTRSSRMVAVSMLNSPPSSLVLRKEASSAPRRHRGLAHDHHQELGDHQVRRADRVALTAASHISAIGLRSESSS